MYKKVSIPKNGDGAGCPVPKDPNIVIIDIEDVVKEPTRTVGDTKMVGDYELKKDAKAVSVYGTPNSIQVTEEYSGDADARGVQAGVAFSHPGDSDAVKSLIEHTMNRGVIILVKGCDGSSAGKMTAVGSVCNPLFLSVETTNNNESNKRTLTFKQEMNSQFLPGTYTGAVPALADPAEADVAEGA